MYLLDTDILVSLLRRPTAQALLSHMRSAPREAQFVSSVSAGELWYGAFKLEREGYSELDRVESLLSSFSTVSFDHEAARTYGQLRVHLERQGNMIGDADTRIAAIALSHDLTVVTANLRHLSRIPNLRLENWLEA